MGFLANKVPLVGQADLVDGYLSQVVDLSADTTLIHTGKGRLIGYKVNIVLSAHTVKVGDDTAALFTMKSAEPIGNFIQLAGDVGLEYLTSLLITPNASSTGEVTFVYQPYPSTQ